MLNQCFPQTTPSSRRSSLESIYQFNMNRQGYLGRGSYGKVFRGVHRITRKAVAIKVIESSFSDPIDIKRLFREISALRILKEHPNIVSLEYAAASATGSTINEIDLVFERYATDLDQIIRSRQTLSIEHIQFFLYQILCGIHYVHSAKLVHRDLKPSNILTNADCHIAICDFGLARTTEVMEETNPPASIAPPRLCRDLTDYVVTRWYRSPELLLQCRGAGAAQTDMWSIGCILAELLLGEPLFPGESGQEVINLILNLIGTPEEHNCEWINNIDGRHYVTHYPKMPGQNFQEKFTKANGPVLDLLAKLLEFNPTKRITAEQALQHPFFASLFNSQDVLTFPLQPRSAIDQSASDSYHQFETQLEDAHGHLSVEITRRARKLILEEIDRYRLETSPTLTALTVPGPNTSASNDIADPASAVASSSPSTLFYFDSRKAQVPSTAVDTQNELSKKNS